MGRYVICEVGKIYVQALSHRDAERAVNTEIHEEGHVCDTMMHTESKNLASPGRMGSGRLCSPKSCTASGPTTEKKRIRIAEPKFRFRGNS